MDRDHWSKVFHSTSIWRGATMGLGAMLAIDGVSFALFGQRVAAGPSFYLLNQFPLGMRSVGVVMGVIGVLLLLCKKRNRHAEIILFCSFVVGVAMVCFTIGGWIAVRDVGISGFSKWFFVTWLSLWLAATTRRGTGADCGDTSR